MFWIDYVVFALIEHAVAGTAVLIVEATDADREPGSKIRFIELSGPDSELFKYKFYFFK